MQMPQEPPPQSQRLEDLLPDARYIRRFDRHTDSSASELYLHLELPSRAFGRFDALQKLLVEKGVPIGSIREGWLTNKKRVYKGNDDEFGSYNLTVKVSSMDGAENRERIWLKISRNVPDVGRAAELFRVVKEYEALF